MAMRGAGLTHPHRKVLLGLLARVCQEGFPGAAAHIRLQLHANEDVRKYLEESVSLRPGALDMLGDALSVKEVEDWLAAIDVLSRTEFHRK